jgi:hypothetical protein
MIYSFFAGIILFVGVIAFPYIMKKVLKIQYFKGMGSGICCVILCILCFMGVMVLWAFFIIEHKGISIGFTLTFSDWFLIPKGFDIEYYYLIAFIALNICVFLLIICFVNKAMKNFESNKQIFMFISGFGFAFILPFTLSIFLGLDAFDFTSYYRPLNLVYETFALSFEFFILSYLLQIDGVILLVFIWLKNSKKLFLFIALGAFFIPFLVLFISLMVRSRFMSDCLTPLTFWVALVLGIFFYIKNNNNDEAPPQEENHPLVPAY